MLNPHNSATCSCKSNPTHSIIKERKDTVTAFAVSECVYRVSDSQGIVFVTMELCCCSRACGIRFQKGGGGLVEQPIQASNGMATHTKTAITEC